MYKASLDKAAIAITIAIGILFLLIAVSVPYTMVNDTYIPALGCSVFFVATFFVTWLLHPVGYEITTDAVLIKRPANSIKINRHDIESVRLLEKKEASGANRTFGSGGLFGYFGKFNEYHLGKMTWYVTNRSNMVLLKMRDGKNYVVSPDDTYTFIKEFGKLAKG